MRKLILLFIIFMMICPDGITQGGLKNLWFDGADDYVNCGTDTTLDLAGQLTVEAWIKGNPVNSSYARIIDKYQFYAKQGFNLVREPGTNSIMLDFWATDGSKLSTVANKPVFDEQWHYVAATFDGNTVKMYVDGKYENQLITGNKIIQHCPDPLMIGDGFDGAAWFPYGGYIDEVRVWNTALDSLTIREWAHKTITQDHAYWSNLVGYWKFDEGSGSMAGDSSSAGNNGVLTNMDTTSVWFTSTAPLATNLTDTLLNISATWVSVDSNYSSIFSVEDNDISGDDCVIFGHTDADLSWINTDVPVDLGVINRLNRVWRMEVYDTLTGNIIFDVSPLGINNGDVLKLLVDSDNSFADADTVHGSYNAEDSTFSVHDYSYKHGYYYTLGTSENITSLDEWDSRNNGDNTMIHQVYPNPFTASTTIEYELQQPSTVQITIYNHLGERVAVVAEQRQPKGKYQITRNFENLPSGVYYYVLRTDKETKTTKMIKLK